MEKRDTVDGGRSVCRRHIWIIGGALLKTHDQENPSESEIPTLLKTGSSSQDAQDQTCLAVWLPPECMPYHVISLIQIFSRLGVRFLHRLTHRTVLSFLRCPSCILVPDGQLLACSTESTITQCINNIRSILARISPFYCVL